MRLLDNFAFQRLLLLSALLSAGTSAVNASASFEYRHPMVVKASAPEAPSPPPPLSISLGAAELPEARVGQYYDFDFGAHLAMEGEAPPPRAELDWAIQALQGVAPEAGPVLNDYGVLGWTPLAKGVATFEVVAEYGSAQGRRAYTIVVNGVPLHVSGIVAGGGHTCAITIPGEVKCWGRNQEGQLGNGTMQDSSEPVAVEGLPPDIVQLALGSAHSCALSAAGELRCWGHNNRGQLGTGDKVARGLPGPVSGAPAKIRQVDAGSSHTCVVTESNRAWCWGYNNDGRLGNGNFTEQLTPSGVVGLDMGVRQVAAGGHLTCAVTTGGAGKCWGNNQFGQLGNGGSLMSSTPVNVSGLSSGVVKVDVGLGHACALLTDGTARCWGDNRLGQVGDGSFVQRGTPVEVTGLTGVDELLIGWEHTCAMVGSGVKCWGDNASARLGDGSTETRSSPVSVSGLDFVPTMLAVGADHGCVAAAGRVPVCWGANDWGQLGDGTTNSSPVPIEVSQ